MRGGSITSFACETTCFFLLHSLPRHLVRQFEASYWIPRFFSWSSVYCVYSKSQALRNFWERFEWSWRKDDPVRFGISSKAYMFIEHVCFKSLRSYSCRADRVMQREYDEKIFRCLDLSYDSWPATIAETREASKRLLGVDTIWCRCMRIANILDRKIRNQCKSVAFVSLEQPFP